MTLSGAAIRKRAQRAHPTLTQCELCGGTDRLHRHHPDYSKPEEIVVVCIHCHAKLDMRDGTRRTKKPKVCAICGTTFTHYSHSRVKNCSPQCLSEAGRRAAMKRWGGGTPSPLSDASPRASLTGWTDLEPSGTLSSRRSLSGSGVASSHGNHQMNLTSQRKAGGGADDRGCAQSAVPRGGLSVMHVPERSREELLDALTDVTRARDLLADTADRLIRERDEARAALDHPQRGAVSPNDDLFAFADANENLRARVEQLEAAIREHRAACLHPKEDHIHVQANANEDLWPVLDA